MLKEKNSVRLRVSPEVAKIVAKDAPRDLQLQAAQGALSLPARDLATSLFMLCHGGDPEIRGAAVKSARSLSAEFIAPLLGDPATHPRLLDFFARLRPTDTAVIEPLLANEALDDATLLAVAGQGDEAVLALLAKHCLQSQVAPELVAALLANPRLVPELKARLDTQAGAAAAPAPNIATADTEDEDSDQEADAEEYADGEAGENDAEEELNLSKYQLALEMGVAEKIKIAMSGDKEWRSIFLKDANKLVSSAVLKNPRITDGEVLTVAKNKSSNDELIRLITLNKDWVKHYEIKKALIMHPKTPLPKALRYMNVLSEKDIKHLAKSRGVSQVLVNNARRMLMAVEKKKS